MASEHTPVPVRHARVAEKAQNLQMSPTRREFMVGALGAAAAATTVGRAAADALAAAPTTLTLPDPKRSGIDHIVVLMMENRSFDHYLGWLPGADGRQEGLTYSDSDGYRFRTHKLSGTYMGCGHPDPDHSYEGGRVQYNHGQNDGWLHDGNGD